MGSITFFYPECLWLRAVLAHEFGHYYGGDQAGPWVYKTQSDVGVGE